MNGVNCAKAVSCRTPSKLKVIGTSVGFNVGCRTESGSYVVVVFVWTEVCVVPATKVAPLVVVSPCVVSAAVVVESATVFEPTCEVLDEASLFVPEFAVEVAVLFAVCVWFEDAVLFAVCVWIEDPVVPEVES